MAVKQRQIVLSILLLVVVVTVAAWGGDWLDEIGLGGSQGSTTAPNAGEAMAELDRLAVGRHHSMAGYSRERFKHWTSHGENCDTRETVLKREGKDVRTDRACKAVSGSWVSAYDGETFDKAGDLDIDHIVPLANAWRTGADRWDDEKRTQFANDLTIPQLVAVSAKSNRAKGDQDPSQWKPPARSYWCTYATDWVKVKSTYGLFVTEEEKQALRDMLDTCPTDPSR
ncbi:hypothetical protein GCM10012275_21420 [Longimycelium tulufanense]|uniref:GmrSD restriction endonucleases C-terminal domain-containing protein n=1 Tax=Longimycelium tulufanense TaxID=907463 RepID=A0A8J3FTX2_9PSEU|nr:HNH endonuclease family protein [Longimycelium tulufanense]GGM50281.1 hypothetical protein GCM10012275_21420 [Longimycelium tulufanense]